MKNGVHEDMSFLETFLRNLLMGEQNELKNRYMHIRWDETSHSTGKQHIQQHIQQHIADENSISLENTDLLTGTKLAQTDACLHYFSMTWTVL